MRPVTVFPDYLVKLVIPASRAILKPAVICRCVSLAILSLCDYSIRTSVRMACVLDVGDVWFDQRLESQRPCIIAGRNSGMYSESSGWSKPKR